MKIWVQTCFRGNDFAIMKIFQPNLVWPQTCFRGNEFATIKILRQKFFSENFGFILVCEEMILQQ
jgi:hypothetical protein